MPHSGMNTLRRLSVMTSEIDCLMLAIFGILNDGQPRTITEIIDAIEKSDYYEEYDNSLIDYNKVYQKLKKKGVFDSASSTYPRKYYIK